MFIYNYQLEIHDELLIKNYHHLLLRTKTKDGEEQTEHRDIFQTIRDRSNAPNVKRVGGWNLTNSVQIILKLDFEHQHHDEIIEQYKLGQQRLQEDKSISTVKTRKIQRYY